ISAPEPHDGGKAEIEILARVRIGDKFELRIGERPAAADMIFLERQLAADLDQVVAHPVEVGEAEIVAEGEPLLLDLLEVCSPADRDNPLVYTTEGGGVGSSELEVGFEEVDARFVQEAIPNQLVAQLGGVDIVFDVDSAISRVLTAEVAKILFLADAPAQLDRVVVGRQ